MGAGVEWGSAGLLSDARSCHTMSSLVLGLVLALIPPPPPPPPPPPLLLLLLLLPSTRPAAFSAAPRAALRLR